MNNKAALGVIALLSVVVIILGLGMVWTRQKAGADPNFGTPYQAVLLDNGQVYYGKITGVGGDYPEMTDAYYIVRSTDPQSKETKNVLVKRGNELHAPSKTFFDTRHIVMIEPVGMNSQVEQLIQQYQSQPQGQLAPLAPPPSQPAPATPSTKPAHK